MLVKFGKGLLMRKEPRLSRGGKALLSKIINHELPTQKGKEILSSAVRGSGIKKF